MNEEESIGTRIAREERAKANKLSQEERQELQVKGLAMIDPPKEAREVAREIVLGKLTLLTVDQSNRMIDDITAALVERDAALAELSSGRCEECNNELSPCGNPGVDGEPSMDCKLCSLRDVLVERDAEIARLHQNNLDLHVASVDLTKERNTLVEVISRDRDALRTRAEQAEAKLSDAMNCLDKHGVSVGGGPRSRPSGAKRRGAMSRRDDFESLADKRCPKHPRYRGMTKPYHPNCQRCASMWLQRKADLAWLLLEKGEGR